MRRAVAAGEDTIVAISTPMGRSGIGVVRLSGSEAKALVDRCFRSDQPFQDRLARYGKFEGLDGEVIDRVVITVFRGPRSYTGEDVAEISAHGNPLILNKIVGLLSGLGARPARPGEFTLRAVLHGKIDLAQAEAVRDFVDAQTESQAQAARLQMEGSLARRLRPVRGALVQLVAELEASIDFADDDLEPADLAGAAARIREAALVVERDTASFQYGRLLVDGLYISIVGKPNVGKSSLFNRLVGNDRAIVTEVAGTTRDALTERVEMGGVPIRFADTAGLRAAGGDRIETIGMDRTLASLAEADLALVVLDGSRVLDAEDQAVLDRARSRPHVIVVNKSDLPAGWEPEEGEGTRAVRVSARTGLGIDMLEARIQEHLTEQRPETDGFFLTCQRQRELLVNCTAKLRSAENALRDSVPLEIVLLELYGALSLLGEVTGEVVTEEILDHVFSTFCVGK